MKQLTFILLCLFFSIGSLIAQNKQVTGTVISADDGEPVIGASVVVKGTTRGTVTDEDGKFTLSVPSSVKTLMFSYVGMKTIEMPVKPVMKVTLESTALALSEVLVSGTYGSAKKLGSIVGSVSAIKAEKIENRPVANFADALQGQVAGLQVFTSTGEPSAGVSMRLRGVGSINSSTEPLFILDGAPISSGAFTALNPSDIESVTVLKDASSTAIYGSRAANGVVVITTKRGKGAKPTVTIKGQYGISQPAISKLNMMNSEQYFRFREMVTPSLVNDQGFQNEKNYALQNGISTDWVDYFFDNNAPTWQLDASISGVAKNTNYFISAGHYDMAGTAPASGMQRENLRVNLDTKVSNWLKVGVNLGLSYEDYDTNGFMGEGNGNNWYNVATLSKWALPYQSPYEIIENPDGTISYGEDKKIFEKLGLWNPYHLLESQPSDRNKIRLTGNVFEEITPIEGLTLRASQAMDAFDYRNRYKNQPADYNNYSGTASETFQRTAAFTMTNTAEYKWDISSKNHFSVLAGQESIINNGSTFAASVTGITDIRLPLLSAGTKPNNPSATTKEKIYNSYFGHVDYNYDEKYYIDASLRTDGSSLFGKNKRWATFYSVGAMWNMKKEAFLQDVDFLDELKLKVSYGTTGNSSFDGDPYYPALGLVGTLKYNSQPAMGLSSVGNDDLTWEVIKTTNVALNTRLFNRLEVDLEFYNKVTTDMLMSIPYSYTTGHASGWGNIGSMYNRGIDFSVRADIFNQRDFTWNAYANINYNKNKLTELFGGRDEYIVANTGIKYEVGYPYGEFYYVEWVGVDPADGQQIWIDDKGQQTKDYSDNYAKYLGKQRYAPVAGGFGTTISWKGISLNADFSYVLGKWTINNDRFFVENPTFAAQMNQTTNMLNMWTTPGQVTDIPAPNSSLQFDSHLIENASFLRLKNITIGYSFPERWMRKTGFIKGARIFAVGRNLLTITKYGGPDPEVDSNLQLGNYPNSKQFTFGAELTF